MAVVILCYTISHYISIYFMIYNNNIIDGLNDYLSRGCCVSMQYGGIDPGEQLYGYMAPVNRYTVVESRFHGTLNVVNGIKTISWS